MGRVSDISLAPPPPAGPTFTLTRLSRLFLLPGSPLSQRSMLRYLAGTTARCWGELCGAVR